MRKVYEYNGTVYANRVDAVFCAKNRLHARATDDFARKLNRCKNIELINLNYHEAEAENGIIEVYCFITYWAEEQGVKLIAHTDHVRIKNFIE